MTDRDTATGDMFYYLANSRSAEQTADMKRLEAAGICIFCPESLESDPDQSVIIRTHDWLVTANEYAYSDTRYHWLLIPRRHVEDLTELTMLEFADMQLALQELKATYQLSFYGLASRNGDVSYTAGTIRHLHVHVIVGAVENPNHVPVKFKLSSRPQ